MTQKFLSAALIGLAAAGGLYAWKTRAPSAPEAASAPAGPASGAGRAGVTQAVTVFPAQQRDVAVATEVTGSTVALDSVEIRPTTTSTVLEVRVQEGQRVRRGDVLFLLDDRADRANLDKARAQLARDRTTQADLERQLARSRELVEQQFIARNAVDTLQAQLDAQVSAVRASQAAVQAAEVALSNATLRAPMSGRAGAIGVVRGSLVQPGGAAMVTLSQMDPIGVSFALPEAQLGALRRAEKDAGSAGVALTAQMPGERRGQPAAAVEGRVVFIDNSVDPATGTIRVKGSLDNRDRLLWPGQFVQVRMTLRTIKDAVLIPQAALIVRGPERSVYVVDAEGKAQQKVVQPRAPQGELIVVEGLAAGEKVVVEGKQNLRPGTSVREVAARAGKGGDKASGAADAASGAASGASR